MNDEQKSLRTLIATLMWHMRGSLSREEAWTLSAIERQDIMKTIQDRKELTEKTGMPMM